MIDSFSYSHFLFTHVALLYLERSLNLIISWELYQAKFWKLYQISISFALFYCSHSVQSNKMVKFLSQRFDHNLKVGIAIALVLAAGVYFLSFLVRDEPSLFQSIDWKNQRQQQRHQSIGRWFVKWKSITGKWFVLKRWHHNKLSATLTGATTRRAHFTSTLAAFSLNGTAQKESTANTQSASMRQWDQPHQRHVSPIHLGSETNGHSKKRLNGTAVKYLHSTRRWTKAITTTAAKSIFTNSD